MPANPPSNGEAAATWPLPESLAAPAPPAKPIPPDLLPKPMEEAAAVVVELTGAPPDLVRLLALAVANIAVADRARVRNARGTAPIGLYCAICAPSGAGKGVACSHLSARLMERESERHSVFRDDLKKWAQDEKGARGEKPADPRRLRHDATPEGWLRAMCIQYRSIHLLSFDAHALADLNNSAERLGGNVGRMCAAFDGKPVGFTRARGSGPDSAPDLIFPTPRVAQLHLATPKTLADFASTPAIAERGLLGRFIVANFAATGKEPLSLTKQRESVLERHGRAILRLRDLPRDTLVEFTKEAEGALKLAFRIHLQRQAVREEGERALCVRTVELAGRIAATLALYADADAVDGDDYGRAIQLADWAEGERLRLAVSADLDSEGDEAHALRLLDWMRRDSARPEAPDPYAVSVSRLLSGPRPRRAAARDAALDLLERRGWVEMTERDGERVVLLTPRHEEVPA